MLPRQEAAVSVNSSACAGELLCELPVVISNHADLEGVAANFGIPFRCFPLAKGAGADAKREQVNHHAAANHASL